jgi:hypothetical protein
MSLPLPPAIVSMVIEPNRSAAIVSLPPPPKIRSRLEPPRRESAPSAPPPAVESTPP